MSERKPLNGQYPPNPESIAALRKKLDKLSNKLSEFTARFEQNQKNHKKNWFSENKVGSGIFIGVAVLAIGAVFTLAANNYIDERTKAITDPLSTKLDDISGRLSRMEGELSVLKAQRVAETFSTAPINELKSHKTELNAVKSDLAAATKDAPKTPTFWPAAFDVLNLLAKSNANVSVLPNPELGMHLRDVYFNARISYPPGTVFTLNGHIKGIQFDEAIVYVGEDAVLENVTFVHCVIILPTIKTTPPPALQQIGTELLEASDVSSITLNARS